MKERGAEHGEGYGTPEDNCDNRGIGGGSADCLYVCTVERREKPGLSFH